MFVGDALHTGLRDALAARVNVEVRSVVPESARHAPHVPRVTRSHPSRRSSASIASVSADRARHRVDLDHPRRALPAERKRLTGRLAVLQRGQDTDHRRLERLYERASVA
jgi:hypothetical protein